ncbi:MAG: dicarboxylate transporter, DctM subunit [Clostridia bacterium]|jgi:tripartite ATP-independent transporter DctM subunit|nr:dicarboxylate transporter, DctM subunit [Clostridia bacterium]
MEVLVFLVTLFSLLPLGIPIALILVVCSIVLMVFMGNWDPSIISQQMVMGTNNFPLMAIPFFMLSGELMSAGGLSTKIVDFANIAVGRVKGGLGYAAILASMLFAGLSGSPVADAVALGSILIPLMTKNGYKVDRSVGLICASAIIAPIIPPSIPMIVLGTSVGVSVSRLFMAGIVPGIIIGLALMISWFFIVKIDGYNDIRKYTFKESVKILKDSLPALFMPVIIIGGIRGGIFTPTEAGAFAAVYAFLVSVFWYKELKLNQMIEIFVNTAKSTAVVMFIVAAATAVGWFITVAQIPMQVAALFESFIDSPVILLLIINLFFFIIGMVMDLTPNLLIFGPVLFPVIERAGIDPVFFGLIMVFNLCLGLITPPVGTILYLGCSMGDISLGKVVKGVIPFLIVELIILLLFTIFPELILTPYHMIMG